MIPRSTLCFLWLTAGALAAVETPAGRTVILVRGAGGEAPFTENFTKTVDAWKAASVKSGTEPTVIADVPDALEKLKATLAAAPKEGGDELWLVLQGHGTWDGRTARFNLEGPDLSAEELAECLRPFQRPVVVINSFSSSGPFLARLAGPGRVVITATRSGTEKNFSRFGGHLADALTDPAADLDQDGANSLLEVFLTAARRTAEFYKTEGRILTEHALLDDNGDGMGTAADWFRGVRAVKKPKDGAAADGPRAHRRYLIPAEENPPLTAEQRAAREALEARVEALRDRKESMPEDAYYAELEQLMLELAKVYPAAAP